MTDKKVKDSNEVAELLKELHRKIDAGEAKGMMLRMRQVVKTDTHELIEDIVEILN